MPGPVKNSGSRSSTVESHSVRHKSRSRQDCNLNHKMREWRCRVNWACWIGMGVAGIIGLMYSYLLRNYRLLCNYRVQLNSPAIAGPLATFLSHYSIPSIIRTICISLWRSLRQNEFWHYWYFDILLHTYICGEFSGFMVICIQFSLKSPKNRKGHRNWHKTKILVRNIFRTGLSARIYLKQELFEIN